MENSPEEQHDAISLLNEAQRRRIRVSCEYIDKLLSGCETILHAQASRSPFAKYISDISAAQAGVLEDYIQRIRVQLMGTLRWQNIDVPKPRILSTQAILTNLTFVDVALEEMRPRYMRGSGEISESAATELSGAVHDLRSLFEGMTRFLHQEMKTTLDERLARLASSGAAVQLTQRLADIITRHALVEFRPRLEALVAREEDRSFEVALFGRVSCGKSSLLNAMLGTDLLPTGVNPITAVPTRLRAGTQEHAELIFRDGREEQVPLAELHSYVTEQGNPGNHRGVVRATVEVRSQELPDNVVLVDTPGLGSLARQGARETLAYLPRADMALVLVDAGATATQEDLGTLRLLETAGISSLLLLSKADLLSDQELTHALDYLRSAAESELGLRVPVYAVSSRASHRDLLGKFLESELRPRFSRAATLRDESIRVKTEALRESVVSTLQILRKSEGGAQSSTELQRLEADLRNMVGEVGELPRVLRNQMVELEESSERVLKAIGGQLEREGVRKVDATQVAAWVEEAVQQRTGAIVDYVRQIAECAISTLREVGAALQAKAQPGEEELDTLLRELPRFEFQGAKSLEAPILAMIGGAVGRHAMERALFSEMGEVLKQELRAYGRLVEQWSKPAAANLERLVAGYADEYRVNLQRLNGLSVPVIEGVSLLRDLKELQREIPSTSLIE